MDISLAAEKECCSQFMVSVLSDDNLSQFVAARIKPIIDFISGQIAPG